MKRKIYLAIPFSGLEELSFQVANEVSALLISKGIYAVFSPISHSYSIGQTGMVENSYEVWLGQDEVFVQWSDEVFVIDIVGYFGKRKIEKSPGVQREISWAKEQGKPVTIIRYNPKTKKLEIPVRQ